MVLPTFESRGKLIERLGERGISAVFHYMPLHLSKMGRSFGGADADCPVTERISERLVRLPFFNDLEEADLDRITREVLRILPDA
jgi:dTDP-4-amino-4,6-dideoxygalactose transaminase